MGCLLISSSIYIFLGGCPQIPLNSVSHTVMSLPVRNVMHKFISYKERCTNKTTIYLDATNLNFYTQYYTFFHQYTWAGWQKNNSWLPFLQNWINHIVFKSITELPEIFWLPYFGTHPKLDVFPNILNSGPHHLDFMLALADYQNGH